MEKIAGFPRINRKRALITLLALAMILPLVTMAGNKHKIYVDDSASGKQDGSSSHPYKTISQAIRKADSHTRIYVKKGKYNENITLPDGVELYGSKDSGDSILDAKDKSSPAITLKGGAKIVRMTIRDGKNGIKTATDGKVKIIDCNVKDNHREGIYIDGDSAKEGTKVSIVDSNIESNGNNGIFSERRMISVEDSRIKNNGSDGISLSIGANAWIKSDSIRQNSGSGVKVRLDEAWITIDDSTLSDNDDAGLKVISYGRSGHVGIKDSAVRYNDDFGIKKVSRDSSSAVWSGLVIQKTSILGNGNGGISPVLKFR